MGKYAMHEAVFFKSLARPSRKSRFYAEIIMNTVLE